MSGQDWMDTLRQACAEQSQVKVAKRIGYSPATISQVLKGNYRGDMASIEGAVRGALMGGTVACPALMQDIPTHKCMRLQRAPFSNTNAMTNRIRQKCRSGECPHSRLKPQEIEEAEDVEL